MCAAKQCDCLSYITLLILAYPWAGLQDKLACNGMAGTAMAVLVCEGAKMVSLRF